MAGLFGPAIGARTSRQNELGYTTHRASAQSNTINSFIVPISLVLLYLLSGGRPTGPTTASPANLPSGKAGCCVPPTNITTKRRFFNHKHRTDNTTHSFPLITCAGQKQPGATTTVDATDPVEQPAASAL